MTKQIRSGLIGITLVAILTVLALLPLPVSAQSTREYVSNGVVAEAPTMATRYFIPMATASGITVEQRDCLMQVGDGLLCTGPTILTPTAVDAEDATQVSEVAGAFAVPG